jgi:hypothetical protein
VRHSTFARITNGTIESIGTNDLPSMVKKKVTLAGIVGSSTEAFPATGLALQLEVPTAAVASISGRKLGDVCWNSGLDGRLEAVVTCIQLEAVAASIQLEAVAASIQLQAMVAATSEAARQRDTLPTASWVLDPYENPVT